MEIEKYILKNSIVTCISNWFFQIIIYNFQSICIIVFLSTILLHHDAASTYNILVRISVTFATSMLAAPSAAGLAMIRGCISIWWILDCTRWTWWPRSDFIFVEMAFIVNEQWAIIIKKLIVGLVVRYWTRQCCFLLRICFFLKIKSIFHAFCTFLSFVVLSYPWISALRACRHASLIEFSESSMQIALWERLIIPHLRREICSFYPATILWYHYS